MCLVGETSHKYVKQLLGTYAMRHLAKEKQCKLEWLFTHQGMSLELDLEECIAFEKLRGIERIGVKDVWLISVNCVEGWLGNESVWSRDSYRIKVGFKKTN